MESHEKLASNVFLCAYTLATLWYSVSTCFFLVPYLINEVISYNIEISVKDCSPILGSCWSFIGDIRNCTFQYRNRNSGVQLAIEDIPINTTVDMTEVKKFTHYDFKLIAETENGLITFELLGELRSYPSKSCSL